MAEVGTGNSVDVNFRVQQTSFDAKGEAGANINTQTADAHDNLDPSLTLALFSEKHPEMCPIFTVTTENFQALQAAQNDGIFISPTTLTLAQGLHESYVQIKNPSDRVLLSDFVTALGFPEFAYEIIVQCRINYEELTSWDRERQNVITVQGTVNEMTSADPNPKQVKEAKDDDNQKESLSLCQDIITKLVGVLLNFSDLHDQFCVACSNVGMVQIFVEMTKELKDAISHNVKFVNPQTQHIKNFTVRGRMLSRILGVLHNLSKRVPTRVNFAACQALDTLIPLLKAEVALFGAKCLLILAYLIDESNNHMIMADEGPIKLLTNLLKMSLSYSNHRCIGFSSSELAEGLTQIAVNDNNKKMIAKCGAIQILVRMLQTAKDNEEKLNACNAFWTLAFDEENQMEIKANEQAISELEKLLTDENIEIQRAAAGALWECNGKERYAEEKKQKVGLQQITDAKHVMISYQWDVQKLVVQIKNKLEAGGFKVWMDIDEMGGSTLESMARAVENASVVLVCVSQKYKESPNCRSEAEYTYQLRKDVIPLMVDGKYRPDGWLGFIVGSKFWIDFSEKHKLDSNVTKLVKELGTRGKIEVVESIVQATVEDVVDASPHPSIRSWTCSDVKTWLKAIGLENRLDSKALQRLDGRRLLRLHDLRKESPEFFYSSIKTDLKLGNVFDVLDFVDELENLTE